MFGSFTLPFQVRNRAKELADLLGDVDRIRQERRKAKQNRSKYQGVGGGPGMGSGGGGGMSFQSMTGSRYGGFGSDEYPARMGGGGGGGGGYDGGE
jgi:epsin